MGEKLMDEVSEEERKESENYTDEDLADDSLLASVSSNAEVKSALKQYLEEIGQYKLLTPEEEEQIKKRIIAGDNSARKLFSIHYLRLVIKIATKLRNIATTFELNDLIQEGNLGLIEASEKYDPTRNVSFKSYAYSEIRYYILNAVNLRDSKVYIPKYLKSYCEQYRRYKGAFFSKYERIPTAQETMEELKISEVIYQKIIEIEKNVNKVRSTNELMGEEKDDSQLEDFIPSTENGYRSFEEDVDKKILMYKVKNIVTPLEYYILYYRIFMDTPMSLQKIADVFFLTRSRIEQIEKKAFSKVKSVLYHQNKQFSIPLNHLGKESFIPISPYTVIRLKKLKEELNDYDYYLIYSVWYQKLDVYQLSRNTGIRVEKLTEQIKTLMKRYAIYLSDDSLIREELQKLKEEGKISSVYNSFSKFKPVYNAIEETVKFVQNMSYEEARKMIGDKYDEFTPNQREMFDSYFQREFVTISPSELNKVSYFINAYLLGYYNSRYLEPEKLYPVLLKHKDDFSDGNYQTLLCTYFKGLSKMERNNQEIQLGNISFSLHRLESYYYNLDCYYYYSIPVDDIKAILENPRYKFTEKQKELIRLKYGIGCRCYSPSELASKENMDYKSFRDSFRLINRKLLHIYVGLNRVLDVYDCDRYLPFISNPQYMMTEETRQVCYLYFVEKKNYKEIVEIMKIRDTTRVSNILTEAIRKMDFWYYGMVDFPILDSEKVKEIINSNQYRYTKEEILIIEGRYCKGIAPEDLSIQLHIDRKLVKKTLSVFMWQYVFYNTKNCFTQEQVEKEVLCHISDSVLTEKEREIASLYYGIKCKYNETGQKLYGKGISELLNEDLEKIYNYLEAIKHRIGGSILRIVTPPFGDIPRSELISLLKDPHIPITNYEKELLKAVKGIGCEVAFISDLAKKYGVTSGSVTRRIKRAILSLKKYQAGELEPKVDYELDVVPNLKYFPLFAQNILIRRYRDHDTNKKIGMDLGITLASAEIIVMKIERRFLYYLKNKKAKKFDFDYARSIFHKQDFPFYGDLEKALAIYNRTFGDDGLRPEGKSDLDFLDDYEKSFTSISTNRLMVATLKYRDGIRKVPSISYEDLKTFYEERKDNYSSFHRKKFERQLGNFSSKKGLSFERNIKDSFVIIEFLKSREELPFSFHNISRSEAKKMVVNNPYHLSKSKKAIILNKYQISRRELMSGKSQLKLLKLIEESALKYRSDELVKVEELRTQGRSDAGNRTISEELTSPYINTVDMHFALESLPKTNSNILITTPIVDLIFAHLREHHYTIDVVTMDRIYEYVYLLEKYVLMAKDYHGFYNFFHSAISPNLENSLPNMDERTKAFWNEIFSKKENQRSFATPYERRDLSCIRTLNSFVPFLRTKNKIDFANVHFYEDIPNKYYSQINIADEIDNIRVKDAKEILKEYRDYLTQEGVIISYFRQGQDSIPEIFDGENYSVYDARPVRKGMLKHNYETSDKIIVLRK